MKKAIPFIVLVLLFTAGCSSQNAEDAAKGFLTETLNDFKNELPNELKMIDSFLLDSTSIKRKIAETTNLDSLEKYNELLKDTRNGLQKDISTIDSVSSEIKKRFEFN